MSTLEQIEAAILTLPSGDFQRLRQWFFDLDFKSWDEQLEARCRRRKIGSFSRGSDRRIQGGALSRNLMHYTTRRFWKCYDDLPKTVQESADQCYGLLKADPSHPSLHFKKIGKKY